jgi:hypothetical protein
MNEDILFQPAYRQIKLTDEFRALKVQTDLMEHRVENAIGLMEHKLHMDENGLHIGDVDELKLVAGSVQIGQPGTTGSKAVSIGFQATGGGENSIAIGNNAIVEGNNDVTGPARTGDNSVVIGANARSDAPNAVAVGFNAYAGPNGVAIGYNSYAHDSTYFGEGSIAIGSEAESSRNSIHIGSTQDAITLGRITMDCIDGDNNQFYPDGSHVLTMNFRQVVKNGDGEYIGGGTTSYLDYVNYLHIGHHKIILNPTSIEFRYEKEGEPIRTTTIPLTSSDE